MKINILQFDKARLCLGWFLYGGRFFKVLEGAWNFYVPALNIKLAYTRDGNVHCLRPVTPPFGELMSGAFDGKRIGQYSADDWKQALGKSTRRRAAENYIAAHRLHAAGLGPKPFGIIYVRNFAYKFSIKKSETAGIMIENILNLAPKKNATEENIVAAGVMPDRLKSCIRQQINGYVSDLNSVVGVMPLDAEQEIAEIVSRLAEEIGD
jgi:hypothetical protein